MGIFFLTKLRFFPHKVCFIINMLSPTLVWDICRLYKTHYWSVRALHACCVSAHCCLQNFVLGVHPSGGKRDGIWRVLNCDCMEDEGGKIQGLDFCRCSHGRHHLGEWRNHVSGILEERCHTQFRTICADLKDLAKQEDEPSPYHLYSSDLAPSEFHLSGPQKDAIEVAVLQMTVRWITECHVGLQFISRVLSGWYTVSYQKVEKVCC